MGLSDGKLFHGFLHISGNFSEISSCGNTFYFTTLQNYKRLLKFIKCGYYLVFLEICDVEIKNVSLVFLGYFCLEIIVEST